ncbi:hypothetical protein KQX54_018307 [Cotesia glomerata]|uniref:Uncharacterized protein n=1 Tax=Cotesia glomerata TaxID=32391 RepID=A0AAV7J0G0_COTGL|nr:hypothetical protein KQX54_018307 [Cotesia glomerata]
MIVKMAWEWYLVMQVKGRYVHFHVLRKDALGKVFPGNKMAFRCHWFKILFLSQLVEDLLMLKNDIIAGLLDTNKSIYSFHRIRKVEIQRSETKRSDLLTAYKKSRSGISGNYIGIFRFIEYRDWNRA